MEAWLGIIGVIAGWVLSETTKTIRERRKILKSLESAAFVCLDRLLKIQNAHARGDQKQRDEEIYHLGEDLYRYRDAIAANSKMRKDHWPLYRRTMPLLLEHDVNGLDELISAYETNLGAID